MACPDQHPPGTQAHASAVRHPSCRVGDRLCPVALKPVALRGGAVGPVDLTPFVPRLLLGRPPSAPRHWQVDATMAFIDISGFTSLSEQLARRGRVGAEDLVSTLTRIFTLLMSATDDGGDVVKFAGDALLV